MSKFNKEEYEQQARLEFSVMSNAALLESVIGLAAGDDWDGNFTEQGRIDFDIANEILHERLADWIKQ